ncbi:alpha/beta fold hydrolase [Halobaculum litoreum]|uniref:Alpha/beta fold hydrolase n=1 Tax=Halobaculum litoreum TaxID=3031998 RepID=A0ABD5XXQ5_9EURY
MPVTTRRHDADPEGDFLDHEYRRLNDVTLHVVSAGDPADPVVVLLHGFPEFWYGWHRQIRPLVEAGYRVVVPDQRGYNRSEKPDGVKPYRVAELSRDVVALIRSEGAESAHVVGHDWGRSSRGTSRSTTPNGSSGWRSRTSPTRRRSVGRSCGPPSRCAGVGTRSRSSAVAPGAARRTRRLRAVDAAPPRQRPHGDVHRGRPRPLSSRVVAARRPAGDDQLYRAVPRYPRLSRRSRVDAPTLVMWGERDEALVPELAPASLAFCADGRLERFPDAGHFVTHERPDAVASSLVDHLDEHR